MKRVVVLVVALGASALGSALATACSSSDEEAAPTRPVVPAVDAGPDPGDAGEGGTVDPGCLGPNGCFTCEPTKNDEILNACTDGQCTPFDNAARLPLYKAGAALPPVP